MNRIGRLWRACELGSCTSACPKCVLPCSTPKLNGMQDTLSLRQVSSREWDERTQGSL